MQQVELFVQHSSTSDELGVHMPLGETEGKGNKLFSCHTQQ